MSDVSPRNGVGDPTQRQFSTSFRGFDTNEVRAYLRDVAAELQALRAELAAMPAMAPVAVAATPTAPPVVELDEDTVTQLVGEETARVLRTAREAAGEMRARAAEHLQRVVGDAESEASRIRAAAESEAAHRRHDSKVEARDEVERAKAEGRQLVTEAQAVRERVLGDLARRREVGRRQIDMLKAGQERIVSAFDSARRSLDDAYGELGLALPAAQQLAGEALAHPLVGEGSAPAEVLDDDDLETAEIDLANTEGDDADLVDVDVDDTGERASELDTADDDELDERPPHAEPIYDQEQVDDDVVDGEISDVVADESAVVVHDEADVDGPIVTSDLEAAEPPTTADADAGSADEHDHGSAADPSTHAPDVDDIFARLKANRISDVEHAHQVLEADVASSAGPKSAHAESAASVDIGELNETADGAGEVGVAVETGGDNEAAVIPEDEGAQADATASSQVAAKAVTVAVLTADELEKKLSKQLKRVLNNEQNELLDQIRRHNKVKNFAELTGDIQAARQRFRTALQSDVPADQLDSAMLVVDERLLAPLERELTSGALSAKGDPDELAVVIRSAYREIRSNAVDDAAAVVASGVTMTQAATDAART
jgi:DivIVA domain-containing protein